mgnify:CR=1 FL=1
MCCKLACISVFLHKLVYRVTVAMHLEKAAGGRFCSQESREKFFPQGNWMTIPSPYDMLEEE